MEPLFKAEVARGAGGRRVLVIDSITSLVPQDSGAIVVAASHGGLSSAAFALELPLELVVFNDAGVGKDDAGIAALQVLQQSGVPAGTVAHSSARIGDGRDMWACGVISHLNPAAQRLGLAVRQPLAASLRRLLSQAG